MDVFSRYAPLVQDFIYRNQWQSLRGIQVAAGDAIFNTDDNVLLSASTASGKTEAAFFPIITLLSEDPPSSVGCLYIAPLKALINDQFLRLNDLLAEAEIPVWHWHGEVSASHKRKLMKHPSGILQITPESLEAMLVRRHGELPRLFGDLRFIVIDEIHSFLRGDRGMQTFCLIERLAKMAGVNPRRIALSATIGEPEAVGRLLSAGTGRKTVIPQVKAPGMKWRLSAEHFYLTPPQAAEADPLTGEPPAPPAQTAPVEPASDTAPAAADPGYGDIFAHTRGRKCLVFSNSREECEEVTSTLRGYCEAMHEPDRFLIHHGNLSVAYRESAELAMKDEDTALTTCTTATLELGVDIGRLERAFQIGPPYTVSGFLQRMGRTGRRGDPEEMWFVIREEHAEARAVLPDTIPWGLLQTIALVQLYLEERWVEPPRTGRLPFSLLYHQTMSTLASLGEMTPAELASRVLCLTPFSGVTQEDYRVLLAHLLETDQLQRTENGGLIVGLAGERVVNNFKFYAVFQENEEYSVRCDAQELGTIVKPPPIGDKIAIAGRVWVVEEVDVQRHEVYCSPVKGTIPAYFGDVPGDIHTKILERMHRLISEREAYAYLRPNAAARLAAFRRDAVYTGIAAHPLVCLGGSLYCLFPWLGSYAFLALERFLRLRCAKRLGLRGFHAVRPYFIQFSMSADEEEFYRVLREEAAQDFSPEELLFPKEVPVFDKYDEYLPEALVRRGFAFGVLDLSGMKARVNQMDETWRGLGAAGG